MACLKVKVSTVKDEDTKVAVAEWDEVDPASSMIQANPAHLVTGFQAALVYMQKDLSTCDTLLCFYFIFYSATDLLWEQLTEII